MSIREWQMATSTSAKTASVSVWHVIGKGTSTEYELTTEIVDYCPRERNGFVKLHGAMRKRLRIALKAGGRRILLLMPLTFLSAMPFGAAWLKWASAKDVDSQRVCRLTMKIISSLSKSPGSAENTMVNDTEN